MRLAELQHALRATDPAAVLVSPRVLDRVIQEVYQLPGFLWQVPHRKSCVVDRQVLFRHVEQEELDLESDRLLPETVILLQRPSAEELNNADAGVLLVKYWRLLFHAGIHVALATQETAGKLTDDDVEARITELGRTEFEEIRGVLVQDKYLKTRASDRALYTEFAAVYLELRHFAPGLSRAYFPGIEDPRRVDTLLERDVDAAEILARTRLPGAPAPTLQAGEAPDEAHEYYWKLMKAAERKGLTGNVVHAAILHTRAARVAPTALAKSTRARAQDDLQRLMVRLEAALQLTDEEAAQWMWDLLALLDKADQGTRPVEASLLYDLQKICLDNEREIYALDLMEWLLSAGRRPIKRALPGQRLVRITRHLRSASQRLTLARLSDTDRQHLAGLLKSAEERCEQGLRVRFRPVVNTVLQDVGLVPVNPLERAAFQKKIEELLERMIAQGFLTFSDLRDAISRNQLKLPDLSDPREFVRGDPLLRLDRRLATLLDGIYRPSTFYMRLLERFTALNFGTATGRWITLFLTLPFGGAYLAWEGVKLALEYCPWPVPQPPPAVDFTVWLLLGAFLLGLLHSAALRQGIKHTAALVARPLRKVFVDLPLWLVHWPTLRRALGSWTFQLFYWYLLKPLLACGILWLFLPQAFADLPRAALVFVAVNLLLNTRAGHAAQEMVRLALTRLVDLLRAGLLPGLVRVVLAVFKHAIELVESVLFTVDEWLRFRSDTGYAGMMVRALLGLVWYPISYLARFYMVVLVEPGINPIKLPISCIASKFVYPIMVPLTPELYTWLASITGGVLANLILVPTLFLLPDAFGFLIWEMQENWSLYRANRPRGLRPVAVGTHGETVRRLLQPGFHSGTVPALYARLRRAERRALETGNRRGVRSVRLALEETTAAVTLFVQGELVALVNQTASWQGQDFGVSAVTLAWNRIDIELNHTAYKDTPVWLRFEVQAGWLLAGIREPGWLNRLTAEQARVLATALARLYKLAGVDLVREQIAANLPVGSTAYQLTPQSLIVWRERLEAIYSLQDRTGCIKPQPVTADGSWPALDPKKVVFADVPLTWNDCVRFWEMDRAGTSHRPPLESDVHLLPPPQDGAATRLLETA
jgi:hypothetical protein